MIQFTALVSRQSGLTLEGRTSDRENWDIFAEKWNSGNGIFPPNGRTVFKKLPVHFYSYNVRFKKMLDLKNARRAMSDDIATVQMRPVLDPGVFLEAAIPNELIVAPRVADLPIEDDVAVNETESFVTLVDTLVNASARISKPLVVRRGRRCKLCTSDACQGSYDPCII
jgi:hypothetical protein